MRFDCDLVIAADGLWSTLRKFVHNDGDPISVGYVTYRGTIPIDHISKSAGLENVQFWIGPDMRLVQYLIRRGELFNQAAVFKSRLLPDNTDRWGTKEELNERFSAGCEDVQKALGLIQTNFRWPVYELVFLDVRCFTLRIIRFSSSPVSSRNPLTRWSRGRLVLLGDAAHPMLQYAGQGAVQALEDAVSLVSAYLRYGPSRIDMIFRDYEQERISRSSKVVEFARTIGNFALQNDLPKINRDLILRQHDMNDYKILEWLYANHQ
jgi:3-hydroxybenzoate 6-monooxygenase